LLGGGVGLNDLRLSRDDDDLILETGERKDGVVFQDRYDERACNQQPSAVILQVVAEAMADFDAASSNPLRNRKIQQFDFTGIVNRFDSETAADPAEEDSAFGQWRLAGALLDFHLSSSDSEALGGDLAYQ